MRGEEEIRKELRRRENVLQRMEKDPSCPPSSRSLMEVYISALKWVLEGE